MASNNNFQLPPGQQAIRDKCFHPSGAFVEFPIEDVETSVPVRFDKMVRAYPNRLAIKTATHELTYSQLNDAANHVADAILEKCGVGSEPVALLFEHGAPAIIAILGVLKAGKIYVPLDPAQPVARSNEILADAAAGLIVTHAPHWAKAQRLATAEGHLLDIDTLKLAASPADPQLPIAPNTLAYIVYTSGSSGRPKGVAHDHRYVLYHAFEFNHCFHLCPADRCALISPWNFSGGGHIIHTTLLNGAALFPLDVKAMGMDQVARSLIENYITIYHSTPTVLRQLAGVLQPDERLADVRVLRFGGEAMSAADLQIYHDHFPDDCLVLNGLASTECGIVSRYFFDKRTVVDEGHPPAGYAAYGKEILLLDDNGDPVGEGETGEIAVRSRYLASGYWKQPKLSSVKFPAPGGDGEERIYLTGDLGRMAADGCLSHLGRKDLQIKIRGYRIEVGEVEAALLKQEAIKEVVVVARTGPGGEARLVAYVIPAGSGTSVSELRNRLRRQLPDYMIPTAFVFLDAFPLTPTGKINRRLLPDPGNSRPNIETPYAAARSRIERELARIFAEVLGVEPVGIHDNFFELGGHSLLLVQLHSSIKRATGKLLPWAAFLQTSTIAEISRVFEFGGGAPKQSTLIPIRPTGTRPPFFCVHGAWGSVVFGLELARRLPGDQPFYGLQAPGMDGEQAPLTRIEEMAAHHVRAMQSVQPAGPYFLGGLSMGGLVAFEIAQQLHARGQRVALLCLLDTSLPVHRTGVSSWLNRGRRFFRDDVIGRAVIHWSGFLQQPSRHVRNGARTLRQRMAAKLPLYDRDTQAHLGDVYAAQVRRANLEASGNYKALPYAGAVTLLMSADASSAGDDRRLGWSEVAQGGLDIHIVPGNHSTMINEQNIGAFAEALGKCLDQCQK